MLLTGAGGSLVNLGFAFLWNDVLLLLLASLFDRNFGPSEIRFVSQKLVLFGA